MQAELLEAVAEELPHGFGGVAVAGVGGIEDSAELCLRIAGLADDLGLDPGVLDAEHKSPMTVLSSSTTIVVASRAGSVNVAR